MAFCECFTKALTSNISTIFYCLCDTFLAFNPTFFQFSDLCSLLGLHVFSVLFQDAVWPPWVGGVFPARLWAEETARAGCGEREMQRVTFLRNGRSTGLSWRTTACTGTSMKRQVSFFLDSSSHFPASYLNFNQNTMTYFLVFKNVEVWNKEPIMTFFIMCAFCNLTGAVQFFEIAMVLLCDKDKEDIV